MDLEQMYHAWCSIPFMGIIYSIMPTHHDDVEVIVYICMHALPWDKFTTFHRQKVVVTTTTDEDMPVMNGTRVEMVIGRQ